MTSQMLHHWSQHVRLHLYPWADRRHYYWLSRIRLRRKEVPELTHFLSPELTHFKLNRDVRIFEEVDAAVVHERVEDAQ